MNRWEADAKTAETVGDRIPGAADCLTPRECQRQKHSQAQAEPESSEHILLLTVRYIIIEYPPDGEMLTVNVY